MPVLRPLHDEAGWSRWSPRPTRRSPAPGWPASPSSTSRSRRSPTGPPSSPSTARGRVPGAALVRPADRVQRAAAGRLDRRRRPRRDRRGAEAPQREPQDPRASPGCWSPAPACACRSSPATRCRSTRGSPGRSRRSAHASCWRPRPAWSCPTCRRRCRRPAGTRPSSAGSGRRDGRERPRALPLQRQPAQGRGAQRGPGRRVGGCGALSFALLGFRASWVSSPPCPLG
jgi:hypothetical protein